MNTPTDNKPEEQDDDALIATSFTLIATAIESLTSEDEPNNKQ